MDIKIKYQTFVNNKTFLFQNDVFEIIQQNVAFRRGHVFDGQQSIKSAQIFDNHYKLFLLIIKLSIRLSVIHVNIIILSHILVYFAGPSSGEDIFDGQAGVSLFKPYVCKYYFLLLISAIYHYYSVYLNIKTCPH